MLAGSALAGLLLAAPAAAQQDQEKPAPAEETDVLDWLGGSAEPAPPAPAEPVPQDDGTTPLDWLSGEGPAAPDAAGGATPAGVVFTEPTPAARASADKLREAMALELQVQELEASTIGAEAQAGELKGFKKQQWDRIQQDKAGFRQLAGQMSLQALAVPRPAEGTTLSRDALALLAALERGYESSRSVRTLEQYIDANQAFARTADGTQRARAVALRDELVPSEIAWTSLMQQAVTLASGEGGEELVAGMRETLAQVEPEEQSAGEDLAVVVLRDPEVRQQVLGEVMAMLTSVQEPPVPPRPDAELRPRVGELQVQLAELAGLPPLIDERVQIDKQLETIDAQLELDQPLDRRKDIVGKRTALLTRRNQIEVQWYGTQPDPATWDELSLLQDELIRRRMLDLGSAGVLYGVRVDSLHAVLEEGVTDSRSQWEFVEQQQELLALLDRSEPKTNPLRSATLPDLWGMALMQEAKEKAEAEKAILAKSAPKPVAAKKGGGGHKAGAKTGGGKKAGMKPKPKPKPMPPKKGGKGKKKPY